MLGCSSYYSLPGGCLLGDTSSDLSALGALSQFDSMK